MSRQLLGRYLLPAGLVVFALVGCTSTTATAPRPFADFPLFTNQDGNASLNVTVVDSRRQTQSYTDVTGADRVLFVLKSTTGKSLVADKIATASLSTGPTFTSQFTGLRPGTDYQLTASLYKHSDNPIEPTGANKATFLPFIRGEGVSGLLTLVAGEAKSVTIPINSVGTISFADSASSNYLADFTVVEGDTLVVDTGLTSANSPQVAKVTITYKDAGGVARGTTVENVTITASSTKLNWTVTPYLASDKTSETGTLIVTAYNAGGNQVAQKSRSVTVVKGASITPTLN